MTELSMNVVIHRAVRRDLRRFDRALNALTPGDGRLATRISGAWAQLDDQLTFHHLGEHEVAWPVFAALGADKDLLATMDREHQQMADALSGARDAFASLATSPDDRHIEKARAALDVVEEATVRHLDHEESALEPVYQANKDSPEVKAMLKQFGKEAGPVRGGRFFAWLTDGAGPEELATIDREVPKPVRAVMSGLFGRGYRRDVAPLWAEVG